jgi:hypothetical protein
MPKPSQRDEVGRSFSQSHASRPPNKGVLAFRMEAKPVLISCTAYPNSANGMAELMQPMKKVLRQCLCISVCKPLA